MEIVVAAGALALGVLVVFDGARLGARWTDDGPEAGCFPFYVGAILCLCAAALLVRAALGRVDGPRTFVSHAGQRRMVRVLVPAVIYVAGIQLIGIYVASALYVCLFMRWLGRYPLALCAAPGSWTLSS